MIRASVRVSAVPHLRNNSFEAGLAGMLEHLPAVDLEAFTKLDVGVSDQLLEECLTFEQWQLTQIVSVEVK